MEIKNLIVSNEVIAWSLVVISIFTIFFFILDSLKKNKYSKERKKISLFINDLAIFIYISIYFILFIILENSILFNYPSRFFAMYFVGLYFEYFGLKFIQKKKATLIGGTIKGNGGIIIGFICVIISIIWLIN